MTTRRPGAAGLVAAIRAAVPARLIRKFDAADNPALGWAWSAASVTTDTGEVVSLSGDGPVAPGDLGCSCLLSPKCLHVLAVATALSGESEPPAPPEQPADDTSPAPAPEPEPPAVLDAGQRAVVAAMQRTATAVLLAGAAGVGATALQDLLRAVHGCRNVGLHRLARAGKRVHGLVRDLQRARPEFALDDLVEGMSELLRVAHTLGSGRATASHVGTGRRAYQEVGALRLHGLCTEPVISRTGHAGVVTLLCDAEGRLFTVSDVVPGPPSRGRAAYDSPAAIGGATLPHRALGRDGLFVQRATASDDGRLGAGQTVQAVRAGPSGWAQGPLGALFDAPIAGQLDRALARAPGWLFLRGVLLGVHEDAVLLGVEGLSLPVRLVAPSDHAELSYRDNLRLLARAPGLAVRVVGRIGTARGEVHPIAVGPGDGEQALSLPAAWVDRCNLGLDVLTASNVPGLARQGVEVEVREDQAPDPLAPLHRRVARMALGGRGTLPGDVRGTVEREIAALRAAMMPVAGAALGGLADAAIEARRGEGADALRAAWLAAAVLAQAARRSLVRSAWDPR